MGKKATAVTEELVAAAKVAAEREKVVVMVVMVPVLG